MRGEDRAGANDVRCGVPKSPTLPADVVARWCFGVPGGATVDTELVPVAAGVGEFSAKVEFGLGAGLVAVGIE